MSRNISLTGKIGHRVVKPWFRDPHLVLQVQVEVESVWSHGIPGDIRVESRREWQDADINQLHECLAKEINRDIASAFQRPFLMPVTTTNHLAEDMEPSLTGRLGIRTVTSWRGTTRLVLQVEVVKKSLKGAAPERCAAHTTSAWRDATLNDLHETLYLQTNKEYVHG